MTEAPSTTPHCCPLTESLRLLLCCILMPLAEVQALLDDHFAGGKHSAADVVAKAQAVLSESELLRAMFVVGYFPPNTPPGTQF